MTQTDTAQLKPRASYTIQLGILALCFLGTLFLCALLNGAIGVNTPKKMLFSAASQDIIVFCGSALFLAWYSCARPFSYLKIDYAPKRKGILGMLAIYFLALPLMNQIIWWNSQMHLPESMGAFEQTLRAMEDNASALTDMMLSGTSVGALIVNILIVGCLTGFSEELFFRGALQTTLKRGVGKHAAIWISALIFSLLHFQFFGFVPRLLLGAFFGYLLMWSGSVWLPAIAHAMNNSLVVITTWLSNRGLVSDDFESIGIAETGFPWYAFISASLLIFFFIYARKYLTNNFHCG